jgi:uncharacterized coiled-coil DUF342 family protein
VLEKPRVSRDVIIEVLKEHTELIRSLRDDLKSARETIYDQSTELAEHKKNMDGLHEEIKRNKADINSVRKANVKLTEEIKEIRQDVSITQVKIAALGNIMELEQVRHEYTYYCILDGQYCTLDDS